VTRYRCPTLVVDAAIADHLEVLRLVPLRCLRIVERVHMLTPCSGSCMTPLTEVGAGDQQLRAQSEPRRSRGETAERISPFALIPLGQWMIVPLRVPPKCEANLLGPLIRCVHGVSPTHGIVVLSMRGAQLVDLLDQQFGVARSGASAAALSFQAPISEPSAEHRCRR
jgi:hypothetical protein